MNLGEIRTKRNTEGRRNFLPFFSDVMGPERSTNRFGVIFIAATFSFISSHIWMGWGRGGASFRSGGLRFYLVLPSFTLCFRFSNFYLRNRKKNEFFSFFFLQSSRNAERDSGASAKSTAASAASSAPSLDGADAAPASLPSHPSRRLLEDILSKPAPYPMVSTFFPTITDFFFTEFYRVLPSFTWFYWVLLGFTGFYWVLLGFIRFY